MSNYDLGFYEAIIKDYVLNAKDRKISHADFQSFLNALAEASEATKASMRQRILSRRKFKMYVSRHQTAIVQLKDTLLEKMDLTDVLEIWEEENNFLLKDVCKYIYKSLEQLLVFMIRYFPKGIDKGVKVPEAKRLLTIRKHILTLEQISSGLTKGGVNKELLAIVMAPLETLPEYSRLNYAQLQYLQEVTEELIRIAKSATAASAKRSQNAADDKAADNRIEGRVVDILRYHNFNAPEFVKYMFDDCRKQLDAMEHADEQLKWINAQIADNQLRTMRGDAVMDTRCRCVQDALDRWLELKRNDVQKAMLPAGIDNKEATAKGFKFHSDMPVEQLAYYKHLEVLVNKRPKPNLTRYFESISENYTSIRQDNISPKNIRTAYYNVDKRHRERVEDRLFEMIKISKGFR